MTVQSIAFPKVYLKYKGYLTFIFVKLGINIVIKQYIHQWPERIKHVFVETNPVVMADTHLL